jgi:PAS domain S-box-containing protein
MSLDNNKEIAASTALRCRAEMLMSRNETEDDIPGIDCETQRLIHELEIHRIELEMQNAELRQSREEAEKSLERYADLYEFAPVGYFTLDRNGVINSVNLKGASVVGAVRSQLLGQIFARLVTDENRHVFADFLDNVLTNQGNQTCELVLQNNGNSPIFVLLNATSTSSGQECGITLIDITERKLAEETLINSEKRYRHLFLNMRLYASRLINTEENMRKILSEELHDEIGRDLTILGMNLTFVNNGLTGKAPVNISTSIQDSQKIVQGISRTVRGIMAGLRPPVLDDFGLLAAIRWHANLFSIRTGIEVAIQADDSFPRLMSDKELALFRITQEALMNVSKHADTEIVTIKLRSADTMIYLAVIDEGKGFMPSSSKHGQEGSGWGLNIMRERTELIGGNFHLDSAPGKGTTVSVELSSESA